MLIEIKDLIIQTFEEAGFPVTHLNLQTHDYFRIDGGYLVNRTDSTVVAVWISGVDNPTNWLTDEWLYQIDLAEPSGDLRVVLEFASKLRDLSGTISHWDSRNNQQLALNIRREIQEMSEFYEQRPKRN